MAKRSSRSLKTSPAKPQALKSFAQEQSQNARASVETRRENHEKCFYSFRRRSFLHAIVSRRDFLAQGMKEQKANRGIIHDFVVKRSPRIVSAGICRSLEGVTSAFSHPVDVSDDDRGSARAPHIVYPVGGAHIGLQTRFGDPS